jgi:hypothetical protein
MLDLFDVVVTSMFSDAKAAGQKDRLGSIRDLDAAALKLKQACAVLLDETTSNAGVRRAVFSLVTREELAEAVVLIDNLARPRFQPSGTNAVGAEPGRFLSSSTARICRSFALNVDSP